ncbi:hypothetical protein KC318_g6436 [Hortaea werneckii]|nr:hypothetical protein KC334_g12007 [Hortaea werneckii]KAI6917515.1 hypothetical protein KC355_g17568 [Hortaea werneckii]KAI7666543.1 hypothetical protein KC318_g6436 [Hortaea werneckii]
MNSNTGRLSLDKPPTYSSTADLPARPPTTTSDDNVDYPGSPNDSSCENRTYEIYATPNGGLNIIYNGNQLYYIGRYHQLDFPDIIVYGGYDASGPQLAQGEFTKFQKDFSIYVGSQRHPRGGEEWDVVRQASEGGRLFSFIRDSPFWRFETLCSRRGEDESEGKVDRRKLFWMRTHESHLGASRFSSRHFKLVDESSEAVVAVYTQCGVGLAGQKAGEISWRMQLGERAEIAALMVISMILLKMARAKSAGTWTNAGIVVSGRPYG